jgi:hypothetical protein
MAEIFVLFAFISMTLILLGVAIMTRALFAFKFKDDNLKNFFRWLLVGFYFMALPYVIFVLRDTHIVSGVENEISLVIYLCMTVVGLCLLSASFGLYLFSQDIKAARNH